MFGTDMEVDPVCVRNAPEFVKYYRKKLGQLPSTVSKKIAHNNILFLMGQ